MKVYIEKQNETQFINKLRKIYPSVKIENAICDYKPIHHYPDPICDNCEWEDFNNKYGYTFCILRTKKL